MRRLPLAAFRVLELGAAPAATYCARLLGDVGAEVIRVEPVARHDGPDERRRSLHMNRNKLGCSLDLSHPRGRDLLLRLAARSNVVIEGLAGSEKERLALTYEAFQAARRDIIVASVGGPEEETSISVADVTTGTAAAGAVCAALLHHRHTGSGLRIEISARATARTPALSPDPHSQERRLFEPVSHPDGQIKEMAGLPWRFSETPAHVRLPAPRPGEHNRYVFGDLLGLSSQEMAELEREGVIGRRDG
jgi:crotonobetainyl-CoA:carnitine CoA-transferase CaiB-like acyl-CoA transferase